MIITSDADLERAVSDGTMTAHDADAVRGFSELLSKLSPDAMKNPTPTDRELMATYHEEVGGDHDFAHRLRHIAAHYRARSYAHA